MADPGQQLKRVLNFKAGVVNSKKLLFANFTDLNNWRQQIQRLLQRHLLKLLHSGIATRGPEEPMSPPTTTTDDPSRVGSERDKRSSSIAAKKQIVDIWSQGLQALREDELSEFGIAKALDKATVARLGLAAASLTNRDIEPQMPGAHLQNLLFKRRTAETLTTLERYLVLRANLACDSDNQPGWFWVKQNLNIKVVLAYMAGHDDDVAVRKAALGYATRLGLPLHRPVFGKAVPIEQVCSHTDPEIRKAGLEYLLSLGLPKGLSLVEQLRNDPDPDVRTKAEFTHSAILIRQDPGQFFATSVLTCSWAAQDTLNLLEPQLDRINSELLRQGVSHSDSKVQLLCAKTLARRSEITMQEIRNLQDGDVKRATLREYYLNAISAGNKIPAKEIRESLQPGFRLGIGGPPDVDAETVLAQVFKLYTYEELLSLYRSDSRDSLLAYRTLLAEHFDRFAEQLRTDLRTQFAEVMKQLKSAEQTSFGGTLAIWDILGRNRFPAIDDFITAALSAISISGKAEDRELLGPYLTNTSDYVLAAAMSALGRIGRPEDTELALRVAEHANEAVSIEAANAALKLAPGKTGAAMQLVNSQIPVLVKLAIRELLRCECKTVWPRIKERLYDENDQIRKLICAYAVRVFPPERLAKLLAEYTGRDRYFYNVVFLFDRAAYAKLPLRKLFIKDLESILT